MNKLWWFLAFLELVLTVAAFISGFNKELSLVVIFTVLLIIVVILHKGLDGYINTGTWWE